MLASELIEKIELILRDPDLKKAKADEKSAKEYFKETIKALKEFGVEKELSGNNLEKFLNLKSLPTDEAGYFYEFKNTNPRVEKKENPDEIKKSVSEIFYLMEKEQVSCLHSLTTTETWRWIAGCDVFLYIFSKKELLTITLNKKNPEYTIQEGKLFGAINSDPTNFGLVICECRPGFMGDDYNNPTLEKLVELLKQYAGNKEIMGVLKKLILEPQLAELLKHFSRDKEIIDSLKVLLEPQKKLELSGQSIASKSQELDTPFLSHLFKNPVSTEAKEVADKENPQKNHKCSIL